jgi:hypothetical protein
MGIWDKIDEVKDSATDGIRESVGEAPLDQAQSALMMIIGLLIVWESTGYFPLRPFAISSPLIVAIGAGIFILGFIWWGFYYL